MIKEIRIRNFKLVEDVDIRLSPGLNVITGETGSGKTVLVKTILSGFALHPISELAGFNGASSIETVINDTNSEEGIAIIRREVRGEKGTRTYLNGIQTTVDVVKALCEGRLIVHSQNQTVMLLKKKHQQVLFDFHDSDLAALVRKYQELRSLAQELFRRFSKAREEESTLMRRISDLKEFIHECENVGIRKGIEEELKARRELLKNRALLLEATSSSLKAIKEGESSSLETLQQAMSMLSKLRSELKEVGEIYEMLDSAHHLVNEAASKLSLLLAEMDADSQTVDEVESLLFEIQRIKRKFGISYNEDLGEVLEDRKMQLQSLQSGENRLLEIEKEFKSIYAELEATASLLSKKRKQLLDDFSAAVNMVLSELNMGKDRFRASLTGLSSDSEFPLLDMPFGLEEVQFEFLTEDQRYEPISKIASGGELSRLMLALETLENDSPVERTYIFDEVDAGIGGNVAVNLGRYLKKLSSKSQVVVITHLPQVASFADCHLRIEKKGTKISVQTLRSSEEKIQEIARMLSGGLAEREAVEHAKKLIEEARGATVE